MRAGSVRSQRSAPLAAVLMAGQFAADVKTRPLLADTPVGSCLSQDGLLASEATWAVGVITLTKSASTCVWKNGGKASMGQESSAGCMA